jgi:acyl-CoA reductase-like NAD-dependent aldehyde dehydrogenase
MSSTVSRAIKKLNPANGEMLGEFLAAGGEEAKQVVQSARHAQRLWRKTTLKTRACLLEAVLTILYDRSQAVAEVICNETGKPLADALEADVGTALSVLRYYADLGLKRLRPRRIANDLISLITGRAHWETYHPRGVIAIISPWNYPLAIPISSIATALMAGNAVVLKPSELAPMTGQLLAGIFQEALQALNLPANLVGLLLGDGATGAALLEQAIDGVIFTGSASVGQKIRAGVSARGVWSSLELGGSDAMLVLPGCDLEKVASYALWGRFTNAGQACAGVKRLLVPAQDEQALLQHLKTKVAQLKVGPPGNPDHQIGPLISEAQLNLLESQVRDALDLGAQLLAGGRRVPGPGWFYEPTLLSQVPIPARVLQEEIFGPVLPVIPYQTVDEAVAHLNASRFGLTASVFGPVSQAKALASRLECGTVVINDVGPSNYAMPCAPWGGWKASGSGVSHGEGALMDLCQLQVLSENRLFTLPVLGKPMWHFGRDSSLLPLRSKTVLAFASRHPSIWNPLRWLPFWQNRASTRI